MEKEHFSRIDGVGNVNTFGSSYAMRVWLNPEKLAERGLTVSDVISAIKEQNQSAPAGTIGSLPLAFASGAGAGARCGMGVAIVGGMTFTTLCGLLLIPAFYIISEKMARSFWKATGLKRIKFKYRMLRR